MYATTEYGSVEYGGLRTVFNRINPYCGKVDIFGTKQGIYSDKASPFAKKQGIFSGKAPPYTPFPHNQDC